MSRFSYGQLRMAAGDVNYRVGPSPFNFPVYPTQSLQRAVRRLHFDGGYAVALADLDETLARSWSTPRKVGKARTAREQFLTYAEMSVLDGRVPFALVEREVHFGAHSVNVRIDAALYEDAGYSARTIVWSYPEPPEDEVATLMACAAGRALEDEMGDGRVTGIELWHPRSRSILSRTFAEAMSAEGRLRDVLVRAAS